MARDGAVVPVVTRARAGLEVPVEAKLHAPGSQAELVQRPELVGLLTGAATRLVLVDAPAGFGKTTLMAQWRSADAQTRQFAWVSLDHGDNDPGRLWWYVMTALQRACPELGAKDILQELRAPAPEITGTALPILANELAALPTPVVLVLDDYHMIKERACHDQVAFLLRHLPPQAQIAIVTRADPPLPLARLRAAGEMAEIRARELRFTAAETATLLRAVAGVELSDADLADLVDRTEGWPAGVYLAALSLRGHPSVHAFVRQFSGDNRFIVDFLAEEVLGRQPVEIRQFLARTSILARFSAPLCEAVTGQDSAAEILALLERENLFVVPLDDNRRWYRFHHLFAQVLRSQLALTEPGIIHILHQRASTWYEQAEMAEEAVSHALAADDTGRAMAIIARYWYSYVDVGRTATVRGWLRSLGDNQIAASPLAAHTAAWAAALSGDQESLRRWLPVIDAGDDAGPLPDGIASLRSSAALLRGVYGFEGLQVMRESAATAAELESNPASPWYALAKAALGFSLYLTGEAKSAEPPLEQALLSQASLPLIHILVLSTLALVGVELGKVSRAEEWAHEARALVARGDLGKTPQGSMALTAAGAVHAAQGRLEAARSEFELALRPRRKVPGISPWPTVELGIRLAQVRLDLGDRHGASELVTEARETLAKLPDGTQALHARLDELEQRLASQPRRATLAEPLTEREVAVLRLLTGTLSLRDIGQELYVSANTIKTHTQAIYRKLGVSTRHDAIEQARRQGILA